MSLLSHIYERYGKLTGRRFGGLGIGECAHFHPVCQPPGEEEKVRSISGNTVFLRRGGHDE